MVLRRPDGADVALKDEVRTVRALDRFGDLRVGVNQSADLTADGLLPGGQASDVRIHTRVGRVCHGELSIATSVNIEWPFATAREAE